MIGQNKILDAILDAFMKGESAGSMLSKAGEKAGKKAEKNRDKKTKVFAKKSRGSANKGKRSIVSFAKKLGAAEQAEINALADVELQAARD